MNKLSTALWAKKSQLFFTKSLDFFLHMDNTESIGAAERPDEK